MIGINTRKKQVLQAAIELFNEKGFQDTSIQDILKKSNISKGTFYNYFSSKNECLIAILEQSRYEANLRRHEMLVGRDPSDFDLLAEQITVMLHINREQNLFNVFEGIFNSRDNEMKKLIGHHRLYEIQWLSERLIDVYGEQARPYTFECATISFGIQQHLAVSYRVTHNVLPEPLELIKATLRHIHAIILQMMETKQVYLEAGNIHALKNRLENPPITKQELLARLQGFYERLNTDSGPHGEQFTETLLEEFSKEVPRYAVVEVLLKSFNEYFTDTSHAVESKELANYMWYLLKKQSN
ncbi:MAG: TetR/AcrR family transcriptional regulator [Solibacillus sp.]